MKFLVYGSKGWIGGQFMKMIEDYEYLIGESRLNDIEAVKKGAF